MRLSPDACYAPKRGPGPAHGCLGFEFPDGNGSVSDRGFLIFGRLILCEERSKIGADDAQVELVKALGDLSHTDSFCSRSRMVSSLPRIGTALLTLARPISGMLPYTASCRSTT
ncbi:hypothetical protein Mhypo_03218 [Meiothermus hypogaeus]|uniref:Uncharacterized protein n=1 Tax=Meiothermus hypogaeus TaxID=884155 RepID=A0ABX9MHR5_9DEIN|nr:hypothetical protein Mhypo_03218 [Meiothermus hypogaeus]